MAEKDEEVESYIKNVVKKTLKEEIGADETGGPVDLDSIRKVVKFGKDLREAFQSDFERSVIGKFTERAMDQIVPSLSQQQRGSSIMDSGFMIGMGQELGKNIPTLVDVVIKRLGPDRAHEIITGFMGKGEGGKLPEQNINELILSFDPSDPSHIHHYMALRQIEDADTAKKFLIYEKEKLMSKLKESKPEAPATELEKAIIEQNKTLEQIISAIQQDRGEREKDREVMKVLSDRIGKIEKSEAPEQSKVEVSKVEIKVEEPKKVEKVEKAVIDEVKDDSVPVFKIKMKKQKE